MGSMSFPDAGNKNMQILVYNSTDRWSGSIGIEFVEEDQRFPFGKSYDYLRQDATLNRVPLEK